MSAEESSLPPSSIGPRVLVTRAAGQGSALAEALRALGAEPILVPAIEIISPASFATLDEALSNLSTYHWLLFTSANAVERFRARPAFRAAELFPRIAAIGPATADALTGVGLHADLVPAQAVAEAFAASLLPHARQTDGTPTRFLLVRAEEAREHLPETLRSAGAEVTVAPAYRTAIPAGSVALIRALFADAAQHPAAITFTSSSTALHLLALCEAAGVALPQGALRISIGPITSQTLRERGLPPDAEAPEATVASLAETVLRTLWKPPIG